MQRPSSLRMKRGELLRLRAEIITPVGNLYGRGFGERKYVSLCVVSDFIHVRFYYRTQGSSLERESYSAG